VDVFASAGGKEMDQLQTKHFIDESNRVNFASNALVLKTLVQDQQKPLDLRGEEKVSY